MYRLKTADGTVYADGIRYIRLHENGCYVECHMTQAEGICAKVQGTTGCGDPTLVDIVYVLEAGAMHGHEPVCISVEEVALEEQMAGQEAQEILAILGGETV